MRREMVPSHTERAGPHLGAVVHPTAPEEEEEVEEEGGGKVQGEAREYIRARHYFSGHQRRSGQALLFFLSFETHL